MAGGKTLGARTKGSKAATKAEEAADKQIRVQGDMGGWCTVVDFVKIFPVSRDTLNQYQKEGMEGFREGGGVHPYYLARAIMQRQIDKAMPASESTVSQAKSDITVSQADKAKRTMQMVRGRTAHIDDFAMILRDILLELDSAVQSWPKTLTVDVQSFLAGHLMDKASQDPKMADQRRRAVEIVMSMIDGQELSGEIRRLLDRRFSSVGDMFQTVIPDIIKRAQARGEKAAGIR